MDEAGQLPIDILAAAVKSAGGITAVAAKIGSSVSHVSNMVNGHRPLGRETAARLRQVLADVPAWVWVELLAPMPEAPVEAGA